MGKGKAKAQLNRLRMSPRKVRLLIDLIRGMQAEEAITQLRFSKNAAARPVLKLLESAIANAKNNNNLKENTLVIESAYVDGGPIMYRWMPRAFGRATRIRKRTAHVTIILEGEVDEKKIKKIKEQKTKSKDKEKKRKEESKDQKEKKEVKKEVKKEKEIAKVKEKTDNKKVKKTEDNKK